MNKVALLTGASQRLGAATAKKLHTEGYNVIIHYNRSQAEADALLRELNEKRSQSAFSLQADLNDHNQVQELAQLALAIQGKIDVLVNNASAFYPTPMGTGTSQDWDNLFNSNSKAPFFLAQALSDSLKENNGSVINMVDIHAERPLKNHCIYSMAKSSLATLTLSLAKELAPKVRVNGVAPGAILWPENVTEEEKDRILKEIPLERLGDPSDIANTIYFLVSSPYITGQIIAVDGGRSL